MAQTNGSRAEKMRRRATTTAESMSGSYAFVTLLMLNDSYLPGALMLAHCLRRQRTAADLICMVTEEISGRARTALQRVFDAVIQVDKIFMPHNRAQRRQYLPFVFTKLNALRMGRDGDLGVDYTKVIVLDADLLPLKRFDELFSLTAPAGILNEHKTTFMDWDESGRFIVPASVGEDGTWRWHREYESVCPHGYLIPSEITDRVRSDPTNMGINGSLLLMSPSLKEFRDIMSDLKRPSIRDLVEQEFDWPEMQYLTMRWSGKWSNVDARYSGLNGYPNLGVLNGTHYAGFKPWYIGRSKSMASYARFPDFQYWFREFEQMVTVQYPDLLEERKLRRLLDRTRELTVTSD